MTTPMSLQPWWWQIFILIQLWSQFFQMFVYGDVCLSSHLHIPGGSTLLPYGPHFFTILSEKFGQLARFFWANGLPPPLAKNFPYAYVPVGPNRNGWFHLMYQPKFLSLKLSVALFLVELRWPVVYFFFFSVFLDLFLYFPNLWTWQLIILLILYRPWHGYRNNFHFSFLSLLTLYCHCFTRRGWLCDFPPK